MAERGRKEMAVFYRGPCALVTEDLLEVYCPSYRSYAIGELRDVYVVEGESGVVVTHSASIRYCSTGVAGAAGLVAATGWPLFDYPLLSFGALILMAAALAAWSAFGRIQERPYELWAICRGRTERLYQTTDGRTFGQVSRALLRAIERRAEAE
jgi:hypothetical protein